MRTVSEISKRFVAGACAILLSFGVVACGSSEQAQPEKEMEELSESEQKVVEEAYAEAAQEEISAENAEAKADALAKEIEADLK